MVTAMQGKEGTEEGFSVGDGRQGEHPEGSLLSLWLILLFIGCQVGSESFKLGVKGSD